MGQTPKSMSQGKKIILPTERSYHKEYSGEISRLQDSLFKSYYQGKSFQKMGQTPWLQSQGEKW